MRKTRMWSTLCVFVGVGVLATAMGAEAPTRKQLEEDLAWLEQTTRVNVAKARRTMKDGTAAYAPQTGPGYSAFWLRDYAMTAEVVPDAVPAGDLVRAAKLFVSCLDANGAAVDCVKFDGTPIYKPGLGTFGLNPVADGPQFTVSTVWTAWRRTRDDSLLAPAVLDALAKTLASLPHAPSGAVWVKPSDTWDRCAWGFEDSIHLKGEVLMPTLLDYEAARRLAELLRAAGRADDAAQHEVRAAAVKAAVPRVFLNPQTGMLRSATAAETHDSVWGTAFAVWLGVLDDATATRAANVLKARYRDCVQHGQVRHLFRGEYRGGTRDVYQNGGYWGTASGWVAYTLARVDVDLAFSMLHEMTEFYRAHDIPEWSIDGKGRGYGSADKGYLTSSALPLAALRRLIAHQSPSR